MEDVLQELVSLFEHRDRVTTQESAKIFGRMTHVLDGIDEFLTKTDSAYASGEMSWEDVQLIEDTGMVIVFGILHFMPGSMVDIAGNEIPVTESNAPSFQRMVRIGLPLALISLNSREEITKFLGTVETREETIDSNNVRNLSEVAQTEAQDFDWDALTEEQTKALITNNVSQKPS